MKNTFLLIIILLIIGCHTNPNQNTVDLADLNLIVKTDKIIDSVWVSNIGQTEHFFGPFQDTIKIDFKEKLNDLYNIGFYTKTHRITKQVWLNGTKVIIKGTLDEEFEIDTVLNSDLYYASMDHIKNYRHLIQSKADSSTIDNYILNLVRKNIDIPFSFAVARPYIYRNQNNKEKIRELFDLFEKQDLTLKNHFISNHKKIESILKVNPINISKYKLDNIENKLSSIELEKSKKYLLDFWFINCAPCVKDHKLISKKIDFLKEKNIEVIGISIDRNYSDWKNYLTKHNYKWTNYREIDSQERLTKDLAISLFPTYLLIDSKGEIEARFNSFVDFERYLNKVY